MLNTCHLQGRFLADPVLKELGKEKTPFVRVTLLVERNYKENGTREKDFISIAAWRQTAKFIASAFKKGSMVIVEGELHTRIYSDETGERRTAYEVTVNNVHCA